MKRKNNKILLFGMMAITMMGVTGCMGSSEKREQEMLAHMQEKYGVEFQVDWAAETVYNDSYDSWNCSLKGNKNPDEEGSIRVTKWRDESKGGYEDTYFPILIRDELEQRVNESLTGYIDEYKAYVYSDSTNYVDNKYTDAKQLDQYLEETGNELAAYTVKVMVKDQGTEQKNEEMVQKVLQRLKEANIGNAYTNIFCMEESTWEERTRSNSAEILKKMDGKLMYTYRHGGRVNE